MKKLLALVLALVMTLSLASVSTNAAYTDADKVSDTYAEAVDVLSGIGVFGGYPDGSFGPQNTITRAEVAAIVYRLYTGDVNDAQSSLYASYNKFVDMDGAAWAKGYIGYCANAGFILGYGDGKFGPSDKVTGYQALAMILRAVGYGQNNEFTGADWALHVAQYAQQLGVLDNVKGVDLGAAATRELVAELLFQVAAYVNQVTYTPALGYNKYSALVGTKLNATLGEKNFGLTKVASTDDEWGRPAYSWTNGKVGTAQVVYATIAEAPIATFQTAVTECDVAAAAGVKVSKAYTLYVNGTSNASTYYVDATDTTTKIGAQGRLTEVYADRIVMIDTFLAQVTSVADAAYDAAGHMKSEATITLTVFDEEGGGVTSLTLTNGKVNYTYAKGDMVLVNAYTGSGSSTTSTAIAEGAYAYGEIVGAASSIVGAQSVIYWNAEQHNVEGTVYNDACKFYKDAAQQDNAKYTWYFDQYGNLIGSFKIEATTSYGVITSIWMAGNVVDGYGTGTGVAKATVTYMDGTTGTVDISSMSYYGLAVGDDSTTTATAGVKTGASAYSVVNSDIMKANGTNFFVSPYASTNATFDSEMLVAGHLFKFTEKANGTVAAEEVNSATDLPGSSTETKIFKNTQLQSGLVVNANTLFLVRGVDTLGNYTFKSVTGFTNIENYEQDEVDFVDVDSNGVADYVYIIADKTNSTSLNLFYYDGQQGAYTLADGTWVLPGYVDGVAGSIVFANYADLNSALKESWGSSTGDRPEAGQLYIVALKDGVVVKGWKAAAGESVADTAGGAEIDGVRYDLPAAYNGWTNVKTAYVEGNAADTFDASLYIDNESTDVYYSVVDGVAKVVGTMTPVAEKNFWFVYRDAATGSMYDRLALQVYAADKSTAVPGPDPVTSAYVTYKIVMVNPTTGAATGTVYSRTSATPVANGTYPMTLASAAAYVGISTTNLVCSGYDSQNVVVNGTDVVATWYAYYTA